MVMVSIQDWLSCIASDDSATWLMQTVPSTLFGDAKGHAPLLDKYYSFRNPAGQPYHTYTYV